MSASGEVSETSGGSSVLSCEGYDNLLALVEERRAVNKELKIIVIYSGAKDEHGGSWCPDCVRAEPTIAEVINENKSNPSVVFIRCSVGSREEWRNWQNDFRQKLHIRCVPTIQVFDQPKKLEEGQCANMELVQMLLEED